MSRKPRAPRPTLPLSPDELADLLLYPKISDIQGICALFDTFARRQLELLREAREIVDVVEAVIGDPVGEEIWGIENFSQFRPTDQISFEAYGPSLETSSLMYARRGMILSMEIISELRPDRTGAAEIILPQFREEARKLPVEALLAVARFANRPPRKPVNISELEEKLREVARRFGLLEDEEQ